MKRYNTMFCLLFVIAILLLGCVGIKQTAMRTQTAYTIPAFTFTPSTTTTRVTPSKIPTSTKTSTPTRTPTPISTPFSTIASQARDQYIHQLNTLNEICTLPCWGMIIPGKTRFEDIELYMQSLTDDSGWLSYSITDVIGGEEIYVHLSVVNHYITEMYFPNVPYELSEFLFQNGEPEEIWIRENYAPTLDSYWYFELALYYPSKGFMGFLTGETEGGLDTIDICPGKKQKKQQIESSFELFIWDLKSVKPFTQLSNDENWHHTQTEFYYPISKVSKLSVDEFYLVYSNPDGQDECFSVDLSKYMTFVTSTSVP